MTTEREGSGRRGCGPAGDPPLPARSLCHPCGADPSSAWAPPSCSLGACSASSNVTVSPAPAGSAGDGAGIDRRDTEPSDPPAASTRPSSWQDCPTSKDYDDTGWQCGTVEVPLRYDQPSAGTITLALTRHAGHGRRDPDRFALRQPRRPGWLRDRGGPLPRRRAAGGREGPLRPRRLRPPGRRRSRRRSTASATRPRTPRPTSIPRRTRPPRSRAIVDRVGATAEACAKAQGELLPYVGTINAARDLDRLREAVGDDQLTYLGYSYGTILGAIYADLFPDKVRAMVLDGAVDPTTGVDPTGEQHGGSYGDQDFQRGVRPLRRGVRGGDAAARPGRTEGPPGPGAGPGRGGADGRARRSRPRTAASSPSGCSRRASPSALYDTASWPFLVGRPARRGQRRRLGPDPPGRQPEPALPRRHVGEPVRRLPGHLVRGLPGPAHRGRGDRHLHRDHGHRRGRAGRHAEPGLPGLGADRRSRWRW